MRLSSIFLTIGWCGLLLALLMLMPAFWGLVAGDFQSAVKFALNAMLVIFISGALIFSGRGGNNQKVRKSELYLVAPLTYLVLGVFGSFPLIGNLTNLGFAAAFLRLSRQRRRVPAFLPARNMKTVGIALAWFVGVVGWLANTDFFRCHYYAVWNWWGEVEATLIRQSEEESLAQRLRRALKLFLYLCVIRQHCSSPAFRHAVVDNVFGFSTISTTGFVAVSTRQLSLPRVFNHSPQFVDVVRRWRFRFICCLGRISNRLVGLR